MDEHAEMATDRAMVRVGSAALLGLLNAESVTVEIQAQGEITPGQREFFITQLIAAVKAAYSDGYKVGYKAGYNDNEEYHTINH